MGAKGNDPLDGFRGRKEDAYEAMEEEVRAFRGLASNDINLALLQDVLKADNLIEDLKNESSTLQRLATHASEQLGEACARWVQADDPTSDQARRDHLAARAARMLLDWIDEQLRVGKAAEDQLLTQELEDE